MAAGVFLTACGGGGSHTAAPLPTSATASVGANGMQSVTVHGDDALMFAPMDLRAKVGTLRVTFVNDGSIAHTFRIKGVEPDTGNVNGHQTVELTVALSHPGTYYIQCDYHPTMIGTLVVTS